jgi:predicted nucleotidyltransferase component of viral defense system
VITKAEIESKAAEFAIHVANVERDYVFGWLLAGIYTVSPLRDILVLKGGNGLRKAYFEQTRFSSDLDFATQRAIDPPLLSAELNRVCDFVQEAAGVVFEKERNRIAEKSLGDKRGTIYEARLYFKDFYGNPDTITISVRLDITEFDRIYLPVQERQLIHPYSDVGQCRAAIRCLKLEEMLGAKLKCLLQRRYSFDLYDFVYAIFINRELEVNRGEIVSTFLKKTIFEPSPGVVTGLLLGLPVQAFRAAWNKYIVAPKASLIEFETAVVQFTESIKEIFGRFETRIGRVAYFPAELRNPILEAGSNLNLLAITYEGIRRETEPYSLVFKRRGDGFGQEYLYVYDRTGGRTRGPGIKAFVHDKINSIELLSERFEPRFPVELSKAGEYSDRTYFGRPFSRGGRIRTVPRPRRARSGGMVYVVECSYCGRRFSRLIFRTRLKNHKDKYGNKRFGRIGHIVDRRYA